MSHEEKRLSLMLEALREQPEPAEEPPLSLPEMWLEADTAICLAELAVAGSEEPEPFGDGVFQFWSACLECIPTA
ncbi:MAG: hypothetical protein AB1758_23970 [Candidatus Eremiobacterota bacterium]